MAELFINKLHDAFGSWPIAYIPYGGADFGEIQAVATAVGDGDDSAFYDAWIAAADRMAGEADSALARHHKDSARDLLLRAKRLLCGFLPSSLRQAGGCPPVERIPQAIERP